MSNLTSGTDIVLINPPGFSCSGFPYGIAMLTAILRRDGVRVAVVDASSGKLDERQVLERCTALKPAVIGLTGLIQASGFNKTLSKRLRRELPETRQIAGGWWASQTPEYVLRNTAVEFVVKGESDHIITPLVRALAARQPAHDIAGLCYLDAAGVYKENSAPPLPSDLDKLPLPAYEDFNMPFYFTVVKPQAYGLPLHPDFLRRFHARGHRQLRMMSMTSGRGCYGRCDFCSAAGILRRNYSPGYVVDHMELLVKRFGVNAFNFTESLTLSTRVWVKDFCREILRRKLDVAYIALARADLVYDDELLTLLRDSGCMVVGFGFESGNNGMLKRFNKKTTVERYRQVIADFQRVGIRVSGSLILNMPGETMESLKDTVAFIEQTRVMFGFGFAYPYPGTGLFEFAKNNGFVSVEDVMFVETNKMLVTRKLFDDYLKKYNWNKLDPDQLWQVNRELDRLLVINHFYNSNRSPWLGRLAELNPALTSGCLLLRKSILNAAAFLCALPGRVVRKLTKMMVAR